MQLKFTTTNYAMKSVLLAGGLCGLHGRKMVPLHGISKPPQWISKIATTLDRVYDQVRWIG